jgi:transposase-like protein
MAQLEDMRLPAGAREVLVNDPNFLRQLVEAALNRFLDTEITEHLQAGPYERSDACTGVPSRSGLRPALENGLACFAFPEAHRRRIRSTNGLERFNQELKRRTRPWWTRRSRAWRHRAH